MDVYNISNLLAIIGALVVLVNILTEVIKKVTWDRLLRGPYAGRRSSLRTDHYHSYHMVSGSRRCCSRLYGRLCRHVWV